MIGFTLIAVLLSKCVTSTDSDIIVSISHITASTLRFGLLSYVILTRESFMRFRSKGLTAIVLETINLTTSLTLCCFFLSFISLMDMHCCEGFSRLLCHVLLACFRLLALLYQHIRFHVSGPQEYSHIFRSHTCSCIQVCIIVIGVGCRHC